MRKWLGGFAAVILMACLLTPYKAKIEINPVTSEAFLVKRAVIGLYEYGVDFSVADQGAATSTNNRSIKDFVDAIGSTKKAIIPLRHNSGGNTTTYTLTTSETISANIVLRPENGAILSDGGGSADLTINGPFEAGNYQVFDWTGSGTLSFGARAIKTAHPEWGGAVGDGATDDYAAFQLIIDAVPTYTKIALSNCDYKINTGLDISTTGVKIIGPGKITGASNITILTLSGTALGSELFDCKIEDINFTAAGTGTCLRLNFTKHTKVTGNKFINGSNGILLDGSVRDSITKNVFDENVAGISSTNETDLNADTVVNENVFAGPTNMTYAIRCKRQDGMTVTSNTFFIADYHIYYTSTSNHSAWWHIADNEFFEANTTSIYIENFMKGEISNNNFAWPGVSAIKLMNAHATSTIRQSQFSINNNYIESYSNDNSHGEHMIHLVEPSRGNVVNNVITIRSCKADNTYSAIYIEDSAGTTAKYLNLSGNTIMSETALYRIKYGMDLGYLENSIVLNNIIMVADTSPFNKTNIANTVRFLNNVETYNQEWEETTTWNPGSIAAGSYVSTTVAMSGARNGDLVIASIDDFSITDTDDLIISAQVTANDTVTVKLFNPTGGAVAPASQNLKTKILE